MKYESVIYDVILSAEINEKRGIKFVYLNFRFKENWVKKCSVKNKLYSGQIFKFDFLDDQ